ncbi:Ankyrin repeat domain-containing 13C [Brachionus plicatilis]|uniref:Ankyrin repeat domain-containing 13C n=1 Tax=Brachionus plicatilis TaxID=10195 RepID=A0A3M7QMM6_BRAPC|nr:Ankyrin repeat domain-containing 13C [Brachionus plicatilis]
MILKYKFNNTTLTTSPTELHYSILSDDTNEFSRTLSKFKKSLKKTELEEKLCQRDQYGNTALHLAVMTGNLEATRLLLESDSRVKIRNEQFWTPLHEAISLGNKEMVKILYSKFIKEVKNEFENSVPLIKISLKEMLDFYVEIKWDFETWIPFVSRFLPSDVCKVYKYGTKIRIDTTLEDVARAAHNTDNSNGEQSGFSPLNWKRGDLSFIVDIRQEKNKSSIVFLDNNKKTYVRIDPRKNEDEEMDEETLSKEIEFLLSNEIAHVKLDTSAAEFALMETGWLSKKPKIDFVNGYLSTFYDIKNLYVVSKVRLEHLSAEELKKKEMEHKKFLEYLGGKSQEQVFELSNDTKKDSTDSLVSIGSKTESSNQPRLITWDEYMNHSVDNCPTFGRKLKLKENRKEFKAQIAMSDEFPLNVTELNNLLEALAPLGKFRRLKEFIDLKLPSGFPVKIDIPIVATVSAKVCFQNFKRDFKFDPNFFSIPPSYEQIQVE